MALDVVGAVKAALDLIHGWSTAGRGSLERLTATWCNWGHPPLATESNIDERGPWHLEVKFRVWNKGDKPTTMQDAHVEVEGRRFRTEHDWRYVDHQFKPVELPPGTAKQDVSFGAYPEERAFQPPPHQVIGKLRYRLSRGRWKKVRITIPPPKGI